MTPKHPLDQRWNMRQRDWAVVLWIAFLVAAIGEVILFALVNPLDLINSWSGQFDIGVRLAYGLGFVFLYLLCVLASWLTMFMIRTGPARGHASGKGRRPKPDVHNPLRENPDIKDQQW